jgi:hypothetical protein
VIAKRTEAAHMKHMIVVSVGMYGGQGSVESLCQTLFFMDERKRGSNEAVCFQRRIPHRGVYLCKVTCPLKIRINSDLLYTLKKIRCAAGRKSKWKVKRWNRPRAGFSPFRNTCTGCILYVPIRSISVFPHVCVLFMHMDSSSWTGSTRRPV